MAQRVAEHRLRSRLFGPKLRLRVDLHGVSVFGPGDQHSVIRWEWVENISVEGQEVVVRSASAEIRLPRGAFRMDPNALAELLLQADSITNRPDVIGRLSAG